MKKREIVLGSAALCLAAGLFPTAAFAVGSPLSVEGQEVEAPCFSQNVIEGDSFKSIKDAVLQNLYVGNTALVSNGEITGKTIEGVSYDADSATLYLSGAVIDSGYEYDEKSSTAGIYCDGDLTISLSGENRITATNLKKGINAVGKLVISGDGDLSSASSGIYAGSITMLTSGSVDVQSACECLYATSGDIDIQSGTMRLSASSNSWATVIGTANGNLTISNADIEIGAPTDSSATYTYGTYVNGSIIIDGSSVKSAAKQDSFYAKGNITVKSGTVNAPNGVRAQQGGSIVIESGEVNIGGRGLEAIGNVALLDGAIHFSGTRLFAKVIYIDKATISLEDSDVLKLYGTTYILNNAMSFSVELFSAKDSYLDYNTNAIAYLAKPSFANNVSYHIGKETANGKVTEYVRGHIAHCNCGTIALEDLDSLKEDELLSPHSGSRHFDGWYEDGAFSGNPVTSYSGGKTYYAKWLAEVKFDANGGEGSMPAQRVAENDITTPLSSNAFSKIGYTFAGWNTAADGSGTSYAADAVASTVPSGTTLYAQWKANAYTVVFVGGNGATGSTESISATYDKPVTLPANGFTKKDMKFEGWDTDSSAEEVVYSDATQVKNLSADNGATVTLYAVWGAKPAHALDLSVQNGTYSGSKQAFDTPEGFSVSYQQEGEVVDPKDAGSYDVIIHADETEGYAEYNATVYDGLVIEKAPLKVKADDKSMYVGDKLPEFTWTAEGLKGTDTVESIGLNPSVTCAADGKTTGSFDIVADAAKDFANYAVETQNGKLTVANRPVTPPAPSDKTEVEQNDDGSITTTVTKPDGSQTVTVETVEGTKSIVKKDKAGNVASIEVTISKNDAEDGSARLPIDAIKPAVDTSKAVELDIKAPSNVAVEKPIKVTVPIANDGKPDYGAVVYSVDAKGITTLLPKTVIDKDGNAVFEIIGSTAIKVVDNAKVMADVKVTDWFAGDVVDFATARGIVNGVPTAAGRREFQGNGVTTRAMFVGMLHNLELAPKASTGDSLGDVLDSDWFAGAAAWALEAGVLEGVDTGSGREFRGGDPVTREQVAVFLMRYAGMLGLDVSGRADLEFVDGTETSEWAREAMSWAVSEGLFTGNAATGELNPTSGATRAEVATVLMRFINQTLFS